MRGLIGAIMVAALLAGPGAGLAQTPGQAAPAAQSADPNLPYRMAAAGAGAIVAASAMAWVIDGWMIDLIMSGGGISFADAAEVLYEIEGEGGLEAATVAVSAVIGGVLGGQAGRYFYPPPAKK